MAATDLESATASLISNVDIISDVTNGDATKEVVTPSGNIPSLRKALADNAYFQDPIPWSNGDNETNFNQLRTFTDGSVWWSPSATNINPIPMGATPVGDSNWYPWQDINLKNNLIEELTRFKIKGTFAAGFTYETVDDIGLDNSGNPWSYTGSLPFTVVAGTVPSSPDYKEERFSSLQASTGLDEVSGLNKTVARKVTLTSAIADNADIGTKYEISDLDGAAYEVVASSDTGGLYITGLASGRKLKLVIDCNYIDPVWYGANKTGSILASGKIQEVLDWAEQQQIFGPTYKTTRYPVILGSGEFLINPLVVRDGVHFLSDGNSTILKQNSTGDAIRAIADVDNGEFYFNVVIDGFYLVGKSSNKQGYGIRGQGLIRQCKIKNITTENFKSGLFLERCWTLTVTGGSTYFADDVGIYWDGATSAVLKDYRIDACGTHGVYVRNNLISTETMEITRVKSQFNQLAGIRLEGIRTARMQSLFLEGNCKDPVNGINWAYLHVIGNDDYGIKATDIFCNRGSNGGVGRAGVYLDKLKNSTIDHLTVQGGIENGIEISSQNESVEVTNALLAVTGEKVINDMTDGFFTLQEGFNPYEFYGRNFNPTNPATASLIAGTWNSGTPRGIGFGVNGTKPTIQGFGAGTGGDIALNPEEGDVEICLGTGNDVVIGGERKALRRSSSNLTGKASDNIIGINTDSGNRSYTLTAEQYKNGKRLTIKKESGSNTLNVILPTGNLDGVSGTTAITDAYGKLKIYCDGTDWWSI